MLRIFGLNAEPEACKGAVFALGMFDGVHLGHRRVVDATCALARRRRAPAVALTFDQHPARLLAPERAPPMVTSLEHRLVLLHRLGLDGCVVLHFDRELAVMPAGEFLSRILVRRLAARGVVVGEDAHFGRDRQGNPDFLQEQGVACGFDVVVVRPLKLDGRVVSSTAVRAAVRAGDLDLAAAMLGRPPSVLGTVVAGRGLGRKLGVPTLNLDPHHELRPPRGVYVSRARCGDTTWPAVTNVGHRPTVDACGGEDVLVETHLLENGCNLYGQVVEVEFFACLRPEQRFADLEGMRRQIEADIRQARAWLRENRLQ